MRLDDIIDNFEALAPGEERVGFLIDLGKDLEGMPESEHTDDRRVYGCMSQVWMDADVVDGRLVLRADSDAFVVRGMVAILLEIYRDRTPDEVIALKPELTFERIGLEQHLSMGRRNGLHSMVARIRALASAHLPA